MSDDQEFDNEIDNCPMSLFIDEMMEDHGLTDKVVAIRLGYSQPSMIRMFRDGRVKVPFEKIPDLADAIGADRRGLMDRALREYLPGLITGLVRTYRTLTDNELEIVNLIRELSRGSDPGLDDGQLRSALQGVLAPSAPEPGPSGAAS
jgi:hypothetical protein